MWTNSISYFIAEIWWPFGPPSRAPYRKAKEAHELIFLWLLWLAVLLVSMYAMTTKKTAIMESYNTGKNSRKPSMVKEMVNCKFPWGITINEKAGHLPLMFLLTIYINVKGLNHWWLVNNNQTWLFSFKHQVKCLLNINGYERNINVFLLFNIFVILNYYSWELNNFH